MGERTHTFGGSLLNRFIDYETSEGTGDPGAAAAEGGEPVEPVAPAEPQATPAAPEADANPAEPEGDAWGGPSREEWQELQERHEQLLAWAESQNQPAADAGEPTDQQLMEVLENARMEGDTGTEFQVMKELIRRANAEALGPAMPGIKAASDQQAEQTVTGWLTALKVPEANREDVAFLAHGFIPRDDHGNAIPGHGQQATAAAAQRFTQIEQRIRADERQKIQQEGQTEQERLRNLAGAPSTPTGPAGVETPYRDDEDEVAFHRRWREAQRAASGQ